LSTADSLDGLSHRLRLQRAQRHLDAVTREIRDWIDRHTPLPSEVFDPDTGEHVVSFQLPAPIPHDVLGPLIGDVLHNFRSALDHLAYELAVAHSGSLSDRAGSDSEFPIALKPRGDPWWEKRIGRVAPQAQAVIADLQPYRPRNSPVHALEALYHLSNIDKHRRPTLSAFSISEFDIWPFDDSVALDYFERGGPGLVEYGTPHVFARFRAATKEKVEVGYHFTYDIAFAEARVLPEGARVLEVLWGISVYIRGTVLPALEPFL